MKTFSSDKQPAQIYYEHAYTRQMSADSEAAQYDATESTQNNRQLLVKLPEQSVTLQTMNLVLQKSVEYYPSAIDAPMAPIQGHFAFNFKSYSQLIESKYHCECLHQSE